jgi:comEA protein
MDENNLQNEDKISRILLLFCGVLTCVLLALVITDSRSAALPEYFTKNQVEWEFSSDYRIPINTATAEMLEELDGIGPSLSKAIVTYREENGPFESIDDLLAVKGIGQVRLEAIRPYIRLE